MVESKPIQEKEFILKQKTLLDFYESTISKITISDIIIKQRIRANESQVKINNLAESINNIGLLNPITITKSKVLVAGYHRLQACKQLGWEQIPCVITTITDSKKIELLEIDENLIRYELHFIERGRHLKRRKEIYEELFPKTKQGGDHKSEEFKKSNCNGNSLKSFVKDTAEKTTLSERTIFQDIQIIENIIPEVQEFIQKEDISKRDALKIARLEDKEIQQQVIEKIKTKEAKKVGEAINQVRNEKRIEAFKEKIKNQKEFSGNIIQGDFSDVISQIEDNSIDLLFVDPPYMILKDDWDYFENLEDFLNFTKKWLDLTFPKVKKSGRIYICFSQWYKYDLYNLLKEKDFYGFNFAQEIIWHYKNNNKPSNRREYRYAYEPIFYLYGKEATELNFIADTYGEIQTDVWEIASPQSNFKEGKFTNAQKPEELLRRIIITGSREGDLILDPFAGSGTTGVIAEKLCRKYILIEKNEELCDIARGRLNELA